MLEVGIKLLLSYLLGSLSGALVVGRLTGGVDIRTEGSGNAGGTNALRTHGWRFALPVVLIDLVKGMIAVLLVAPAGLGVVPEAADIPRAWVPLLCGGAAVVGHVYPFWFGFKGGKGAATLVGVYAVLQPLALIPVAVVWIVALVLSGYVGLSTMLASAAAVVYLAFVRPLDLPLLLFALAMSALVVYTHRSNVVRMLAGREDRKHRVMLLRRPQQ